MKNKINEHEIERNEDGGRHGDRTSVENSWMRDETHRNIEMDEVKRFALSILVWSASGQRRQTVGSHCLVTMILAAYLGK